MDDSEESGETIDWNYLYDTPPQEIFNQHFANMDWNCFSKYIPTKSKVLEIGCGTGNLLTRTCNYLDGWGIGVDISSNSLSYARRLADFLGKAPCYFIRGSGFSLSFPENTFDVVLSAGVIEHFTPDKTKQMVQEHTRVCKLKGRVIISVPNLFNLPLTYVKLRTGKNFPAYPEHSFSIWELARLMRECGLKPIKYDGFAPTIGLEWHILKSLKFPGLDRLISKSAFLSSLLGYECLVVGIKES
jgi:SAM-dependent methyltransferase